MSVLLPLLPQGLLRDKGAARDIFLEHGLPQRGSPAAERWKYTPLSNLANTPLHLPHENRGWQDRVDKAIERASREIEQFAEAQLLLFVDGRLQEQGRSPQVTPYAGLPQIGADEPLAALNIGSRCEAWRVVLDERTPFLHLLFLTTEPDDSHDEIPNTPLLQTRLRIEVAKGTSTLVQSALVDTPCWTNNLIEIEVAEEAQVEHVVLQRQSAKTCCFSRTTARVADNASYAHFSALDSEGLTRQEVSVAFAGSDASCKLHGAYRAQGSGHIDNDTEIFHNHPRCISDALYKGVLEDEGRGVFHGKIFVAQDAQQTEGYQMSRALLMSNRAQAFHKPELEIYADDVKCSHGSTLGALDAEQLFYLRSRGISHQSAVVLLQEAFITDALNCRQQSCRQAMQAHMAQGKAKEEQTKEIG